MSFGAPKEPVTPENFFKNANKKQEPRERVMPLALASAGFVAILGLVYFKARQHGSVEYFLDGLYFNYNNPRLHNIPKLMPPSPSAHFTVVVDLADLLYLRTGPNGKKRPQMRPYMDVFLEELSQRCEVVLWSSMESEHVLEWIERLDKQNPCFHVVLHAADCTIKCGEMVKDLSRLNRPLENVILVSSRASHGAYQPRNMLFLQGWDGRLDDTALLDIYVFLKYLVQNHNPVSSDVRELLRRFSTLDPAEANRSLREQFHDQILKNNQKTKEMLTEFKRSSNGGPPPLAKVLGV